MTRRSGVEIGLIIFVAALAVAALLGSGVVRSNVDTRDPLAWLGARDGSITRVNPFTRQPVERLRVAQPGDELRVTQAEGVLSIYNETTQQVTTVDLTQLSVGGTRPAGPGVEVHVSPGRIYLVNKLAGLAERLDPLTAGTIGAPIRLDRRLADSALAADGTLWLLDEAGRLRAWADGSVPKQDRRIEGAGPKAVLVAHETGVTVLDAATGRATQAGTAQDRTAQGKPLDGELVAAESSPPNLVPAVAPGRSAVVVVHDGKLSTVDTNARGCKRPGKPVVFRNLIYLTCLGERKIIVLAPDGAKAGADIATPGPGDPELVPHAGVLFVNVREAQSGLVITPDGKVQEIRTHDPRVPAASPAPIRSTLPSTSRKSVGTSTVQSPLGSKPAAANAPANVFATARPDGTILVTWAAPTVQPASYRLLRADTAEQVGQASGTATSAIVSGLPLGQRIALVVEAVTASGAALRSAPTSLITPYGRPAAPSIQSITMVARMPSAVTVRVMVESAGDGGSTLSTYDISVTGAGGRALAAAQGVPFAQRPYDFIVPCVSPAELCLSGGELDVTATVSNVAGAGPAATRDGTIPAPPAFQFNTTVFIVSDGLKCLDRDLNLHTCNGSAGQRWAINSTGEIRSSIDQQCLNGTAIGQLFFTLDECAVGGGPSRSRRWDHLNVSGNERALQNQEYDNCLAPQGSAGGEGVAVRLSACQFSQAQRWTFFVP